MENRDLSGPAQEWLTKLMGACEHLTNRVQHATNTTEDALKNLSALAEFCGKSIDLMAGIMAWEESRNLLSEAIVNVDLDAEHALKCLLQLEGLMFKEGSLLAVLLAFDVESMAMISET